ncbi:hypothetical protein ATANTOWER_026294 [Ataeniobius toweri]|uniref:Uncharacterized protein n=1 Tax=Ataeniobius toweri TaxID=208326 RepID=A0ABU7AH69_9TELE|nr:hypothetical protein [Ataeniobius toweri]
MSSLLFCSTCFFLVHSVYQIVSSPGEDVYRHGGSHQHSVEASECSGCLHTISGKVGSSAAFLGHFGVAGGGGEDTQAQIFSMPPQQQLQHAPEFQPPSIPLLKTLPAFCNTEPIPSPPLLPPYCCHPQMTSVVECSPVVGCALSVGTGAPAGCAPSPDTGA